LNYLERIHPSCSYCLFLSINMSNQHLQSSALSTLTSLVDNHFTCSIYLDTFSDPSVIPECLHHFCDTCIKESIQRCGNARPACRARIANRRDLRKDHLLEGIVVKKDVAAAALSYRVLHLIVIVNNSLLLY